MVWAFRQAFRSGRSQSPGAGRLPSRRPAKVCCPIPWGTVVCKSNAGNTLRPLPSDLDLDRACGKVGSSRWALGDVAIYLEKMDERLTNVLFSHICFQFILLALLYQLSPLLPSRSPSFTLCLTILVLSPVLPLPPQAPSPHQPLLVCKPLQRGLPFLTYHSLLDIWHANICLQVTHQSLTPNKHHLVASLRQPGQQPPLPAFVIWKDLLWSMWYQDFLGPP